MLTTNLSISNCSLQYLVLICDLLEPLTKFLGLGKHRHVVCISYLFYSGHPNVFN